MSKSELTHELDRIEALVLENDFSPDSELQLALFTQGIDRQIGNRLLADWSQRLTHHNARGILLDNSALVHFQLHILRLLAESKDMEQRWLCNAAELGGVIFDWLAQKVKPKYACYVEAIKDVGTAPIIQWRWLTHTVKTLCDVLPQHNYIQRNIDALGDILQLSAIEKMLVAFSLVKHDNYSYSQHIDQLIDCYNTPQINFARLLKVRSATIDKALEPSGILFTCIFDNETDTPLKMNNRVATLLTNKTTLTERRLIQSVLSEVSPGILQKQHFSHLTITPMVDYIKLATKDKKTGINILLYGPPGTGKTQLTKYIAKACKAKLLSTDIDQSDGECSHSRFNALNLAHRLMSRLNNTILCVDECEDIFSDSPFIERQHSKQQLNILLEQAPVPVIWITNDVRAIDPAHLRRFDMIMAVEPPSTQQKRGMFTKELSPFDVSPRLIEQLASSKRINQAHVNSVAKVTLVLGYQGEQADTLVANLIDEQLKPLGAQLNSHGYQSETAYQPELVNLKDDNLSLIKQALITGKEGRLLLYGPAGTGKTGFAYHLSESIGIPLKHVRASDLLGKYVGETEKNIAKVFRQAAKQSAILLLDEADSLLRDRQSHQHSWETTQVNELLTQMECFNGILIASTNFEQRLDTAVARRFDFKLHFGFLKPEQALVLFKQVSGESKVPDEMVTALGYLKQLTPGDFSVVKRKMRLSGQGDIATCLRLLKHEHDYKTKHLSNAIGFVS
jgi:transitional endoplasmic reticulum ATPase